MDENGTGTTLNQSDWNVDLLAIAGDYGPTDAPIHAIHRGPTGYIPLAVKDNGVTWRELGAMQVGQPFLPSLLEQLAADGYFGLNTSFRTRSGERIVKRETWQRIPGMPAGEQLVTVSRTVKEHAVKSTGLPFQSHSADTLRWFNVAYADLDCYKRGLDVGDAIGEIVKLQDSGEIPPATMMCRSGRGLWVFWFLVDALNPPHGEITVHGQRHGVSTPCRVTTRSVALYARIQNAIVRKLAHLGADMGAIDGPRYAPMPGTMKTTGTERVRYWVQATSSGPSAYTLRQLATALGLTVQNREHPVVEAAFTDATPKNSKRQAAGLKGWKVRWLNTVRELELIMRLRDRLWQQASRNRFALYYAAALYRSGMSQHHTRARILTFAATCQLPPAEALAACKQAFKNYRHKHLKRDTYLTDLAVTAAERSYLDTNRTPQPAPTGNRATIQDRHDAILTVISENGGRVPTVRDMARQLADQGIPCGNHTTVHRYYKALGLQPAGKAGRPPKLPL